MKIAYILGKSEVNGPGMRCVIWVQGCEKRCPGCFNQDLLDKEGGIDRTPQDIFDEILSFKDIEGVTFSGGEPFLQAKEMLELVCKIKQKGLSVMIYTGYTYEELLTFDDEYIDKILTSIDILVDGEFICGESPVLPWVGSFNQRIFLLSNVYEQLSFFDDRKNLVEYTIKKNGDIVVTGIKVDKNKK